MSIVVGPVFAVAGGLEVAQCLDQWKGSPKATPRAV